MLIGGVAGPTLFAHIVEYADGWMPIGGARLKKDLPRLRQAFEERDRDPDELLVAPTFVAPDPGKLDYYRELGVTECVLPLPAEPRDAVLPILDSYARFL